MARKRKVEDMPALPDNDPYTLAVKKASDPKMTLKDNPLHFHHTNHMLEFNMDRLREDARRRDCRAHGRVYTGIMSNRYGGE